MAVSVEDDAEEGKAEDGAEVMLQALSKLVPTFSLMFLVCHVQKFSILKDEEDCFMSKKPKRFRLNGQGMPKCVGVTLPRTPVQDQCCAAMTAFSVPSLPPSPRNSAFLLSQLPPNTTAIAMHKFYLYHASGATTITIPSTTVLCMHSPSLLILSL